MIYEYSLNMIKCMITAEQAILQLTYNFHQIKGIDYQKPQKLSQEAENMLSSIAVKDTDAITYEDPT